MAETSTQQQLATSGSQSEKSTVSSSSSSSSTSGRTSPSSPSTSATSLDDITTKKTADQRSSNQHGQYPENLPKVPKAVGIKQLEVDQGTPDSWVERDERMIRLTGKHPYNVEAPLKDLWESGFLTPTSLFFTRSHGATPQVSQQQASDWKLKIHGLVKKEVSLSIDDLKHLFPTVTIPITFVCAGNRRKEQNMVSKSLGFNWGASGTSCALFTGVLLADVLKYCEPINPMGIFPADQHFEGRARHVIFEGIDELPKGKYGTSQRLAWAQDPNKHMMLAWGMNGEPLPPDHGFPLRLVVPGQIGGRMVKWLNRIEVSDRESQHYLHFNDNKVLPTTVTADQARAEEHWWKDPKYIINDLNVNAAIAVPNHDDVLQLDSLPADGDFTVQGYAYTGGGKRVNKAEITLDEGDSWYLSDIEYPEDTYRVEPVRDHPFYGTIDLTQTEMSFAWCFWRVKIPVARLRAARSIQLRATDEGLAQMPRDMYWNPTGMMNNCWFRVAIHPEGGEGDEAKALRFEHPTLAGNQNGGWMPRFNDEGLDPKKPRFNLSSSEQGKETIVTKPKIDIAAAMIDPAKADKIITRAELAEHTDEHNPWFVVNGHVYDGTPFLGKHPGGAESITLVAGEDASEDFMAIHSLDGKKQLAEFHLGKLEEGGELAPVEEESSEPPAQFLHPKKWRTSTLVQKTAISHDSRIFRFALDHDQQDLGMPCGHHVFIRVKDKDGNMVQRAYTPFSGNELKGFIDILIKVYFPTSTQSGGQMTCLLDSLDVGTATVELKGPLGSFSYEGASTVLWKGVRRKVRNIGMVAGGSGITPIWSTLKGLIDDDTATETRIWILDANRMETDILARKDIDELVERAAGRIKLWHLLSGEAPPDWAMGKGRISLDCLRNHLPPPPPKRTSDDHLEDSLVLVCGPAPMEKTVRDGLAELGWDVPNTVVFF